MTEENKAELEAENAEANAEAQDAEIVEGDDTNNEGLNSKIDYEALLAKETEAREKAEKAAADVAFKLREANRNKPIEGVEDDDNKPLTVKQLQEVLAKERQETQKQLQEAQADKLAGDLTESEPEKRLVMEIFKNRTFPAHLSLSEQMEEAYAIANVKKIKGENSELKRALLGKKTLSNSTAGSHRDGMTGGEPKVLVEDRQVLSEVGLVYNSASKRYEKKTPSGMLIWDTKTKRIIPLAK